MLEPIAIDDPADHRIAEYCRLKERHLSAEGGRFIAEGERVVRRLLASGLRVHSVLLTVPRLHAMATDLARRPGVLIYVAPPVIMNAIAGFPVHRGCLAVGERPHGDRLPQDARTVVVLEDLVDIDNLGAMARNAAAFGADALVLSPRCADPFYRKAVRVSVGAILDLPSLRLRHWPEDLVRLAEDAALTIVGAVISPDATPLHRYQRPERVALLLGAEGPGLSAAAQAVCAAKVTIPMGLGADSLNVAIAGAVFLHHLQRAAPFVRPPAAG